MSSRGRLEVVVGPDLRTVLIDEFTPCQAWSFIGVAFRRFACLDDRKPKGTSMVR